jgi:hypothetical protein
MKTTAIITGQARTIKTAQGDRLLIYAQVASGDKHARNQRCSDQSVYSDDATFQYLTACGVDRLRY